MLVASDDFPLPARLIEPEDKRRRQEMFRGRVLEERVVALFDEAGRLQSLATQALANWRAEREQVDRIMADLVAAKEAAARHEARAAELEHRLAEGQETLRAAVEALADTARAPDAPTQVQQALALLSQGDTAKAEAIFAEIVSRKQTEGVAALQEAAEAARHLGALAYLDATNRAIPAYETATRLEPDHVWSWIFLGRLHRRAGSLAAAERALEQARRAAERGRDDRDLLATHIELGDVQRARGELSSAQQSYQSGMAIAEQLAARDPNNAEWQRDLSVSLNKIGDVRVAQGDRAGALEAYEQGRAIAETLAGRDPNNAEWQRDLIVSNVKLAHVAEQAGRVPEAQRHYRAALAIAVALRDSGRLAPVDAWLVDGFEVALAGVGAQAAR